MYLVTTFIVVFDCIYAVVGRIYAVVGRLTNNYF